MDEEFDSTNGELDNVIVLNDEEGNEVSFEFLDLIELDGEEYVVILKVEDTDDESDEESYVSVDDENTLNRVFEIFKDKFKDEFNFVDED